MRAPHPPVVEIPEVYLDQNYYESDGRRWSAKDLIRATEGLPVFWLPMAGIRLDVIMFDVDDAAGFVHHMKRIMKSDLNYPIILDDQGCVCDGFHRIHKALYLGVKNIRAVRLMKMPEPTITFEKEDK